MRAGDVLDEIASGHCSPLDELVALNGWVDGASHSIFPGDTMTIPSATRQDPNPADSAATTTTAIEQGGQVVEQGTYNWTLWGDPSDFGAIYASPQCTELRDVGNQLKAESLTTVEDPEPGRRFLAAVDAMPDQPTPDVQAAIEATVAIYTTYAPVWTQASLDLRDGVELAHNPVWRAAIDVFNVGEAQRNMMWEYVEERCPSIGNSED